MAKSEQNDDNAQRLITPEFRASYLHVFKPSVMKGTTNAPKYSVTMLFKKTTDLSPLKLAIKHAKIEKFGPNQKEWPVCASPVTDGDDPKYSDKDGYSGHWAIKASTSEERKPGVVDRNGQDILEASEFVSGNFARAAVYAYVWEFPKGSGRFGVSFLLDHIQKTKEGTPFGGRKSAKETFGAISGAAQMDEDEDTDGDDDDDFS